MKAGGSGAMRRPERLWCGGGPLAAALSLGLSGPLLAHGAGNGPVEGISISAITHGQMPVIADHLDEILTLAARQPQPGQDFTRVLNYARLQRTWCLWGLMPGTLDDEASPFNACAHAYLAAGRDLLLRMEAGGDPRAADLSRRIDRELMLSSTALELCAFSEAPYDTARIVRPLWSAAPGHLPTMAAFAGLALLAAIALRGLAGWLAMGTGLPKAPSGH